MDAVCDQRLLWYIAYQLYTGGSRLFDRYSMYKRTTWMSVKDKSFISGK